MISSDFVDNKNKPNYQKRQQKLSIIGHYCLIEDIKIVYGLK